MSSSRTQNTKRNIIWSFSDYVIKIVFQFVSRTIIVHILGSEYLGLSSLFTSILQVLNMTDLGFASAIIYNLYKPIAENDEEKICALLSFYRKVYLYVGAAILLIGSAISPFLPQLIKGDVPENINIYLLYFLYLINTTVSYFVFAYKASLLEALQRMDLTKIAYSLVQIGQCLFQIVVLVVYKNYYLFVIGTILGTAFKNFLAAYFAKKKFPQYVCRGQITDSTRKDIWKRVKGLMIVKISGVTYTTFDSIILSAASGLVSVALYNNYFTVYNSVAQIIILIRHAMQASVGNSVASESVEKNYTDVFTWQLLFSVIAVWCGICLLCLFQPFMTVWMGEDMLLSMTDAALFSALLVVSTVSHSFYLYLSGNGLWWNLRWTYILSTFANILMNIFFCRWWGTTGIILATLTAQTIFGLIWQCSIIFRDYFKKSPFLFYGKQLIYFAVGTVCALICYMICDRILYEGIVGILLRGVVCVIVPPVILGAAFYRTDEFKRCKSIILRVIHR